MSLLSPANQTALFRGFPNGALRIRRVLLPLGFIFALVSEIFCLRTAAAQPKPYTEQPRNDYKITIELALKELELHNFPEAHALFEQAHRQRPSARTLRGLGVVSFEMRRYAEAEQLLEAALASQIKHLTPKQRTQTQSLLQRTRSYVGTLIVDSNPTVDHVLVDQQLASLGTDHTLRLDLGPHLIEIQANGFATIQRRVRIRGNQRETLKVNLVAAAPLSTSPGDALRSPETTSQTNLNLKQTTDQAISKTKNGESTLSSPWLWSGVGVLVVGAAVSLVIGLSGTTEQLEESYGGNTALVLQGP